MREETGRGMTGYPLRKDELKGDKTTVCVMEIEPSWIVGLNYLLLI
jgi:hypothetical protein